MKKKIFIECTHTFHSEINTGIQRVVRNILRNAPTVGEDLSFEIYPVIFDEGRFINIDPAKVLEDKRGSSNPKLVNRKLVSFYHLCVKIISALLPFYFVQRFLSAPRFQFGLSWCLYQPIKFVKKITSKKVDEIRVSDGDILLLLDSSWVIPVWDAVKKVKKAGGKVGGVIYDIIPITHNETVADPLDQRFLNWIKAHSVHTDYIFTISQTVAAELEIYFRSINDRKEYKIRYFYLGSELDFKDDVQNITQEVENLFQTHEHTYLAVGSIEPRKNHQYILDAFDEYWTNGGGARLVIVGSSGWNHKDVLERIDSHPLLGKKLFLFRKLSDRDLDYCYRNSSALILASLVEGFGLPIVEAFSRGLSVLCSNIPVFREIASNNAKYFDLGSHLSLASLITDFSKQNKFELINNPQIFPWFSWKESTRSLLRLLNNDATSGNDQHKGLV